MTINPLMTKKKNNEYNRLITNIQANSYQCENCGRKEVISFNRDRTLCSHCNKYIYKSKELEKKYKFMEKLNEEMRKNK